MKMAIARDISTDDILMRVSGTLFERVSLDAFASEMREAIKHFVATDPECQMLINAMTKEAFKGIDLLAVISAAINAKVKESIQSGSDSSATPTSPKARF